MKTGNIKTKKMVIFLASLSFAVFIWIVVFPTLRVQPTNVNRMKVFNYDDRLLITNSEQIELFSSFIEKYKFRRTYVERMILNGDFPGYKIVLYGDQEYDILFFADNYIIIDDNQYKIVGELLDYDFLNDFFAVNKKKADEINRIKDTFQIVP